MNLSVFHVAVAMFLLGSLASSTSAQAAGKRARSQALRAPAPLTVWLRAVDATPSAAQLARTHRKAAWWLDRVARDRPTPTMIRHRAIALLAILTSRGAERRLHRLLTIKEPAFRASAAVRKDQVVFAGHDKRVRSVDPKTGELKWEFVAKSRLGVWPGPPSPGPECRHHAPRPGRHRGSGPQSCRSGSRPVWRQQGGPESGGAATRHRVRRGRASGAGRDHPAPGPSPTSPALTARQALRIYKVGVGG